MWIPAYEEEDMDAVLRKARDIWDREKHFQSPGHFPCKFVFHLHDYTLKGRYSELHLEANLFYDAITGAERFILRGIVLAPAQVAPIGNLRSISEPECDEEENAAVRYGAYHNRVWKLEDRSGWSGQLRLYGKFPSDIADINMNNKDGFDAWFQALEVKQVVGSVPDREKPDTNVRGQIYRWVCPKPV